MTDAPLPLSPPECDLRGYDYMPLFGHRLFTSSLYTSSTPDEFRSAVRIWWAAWQQKPAGSLPNHDGELAMLADYGRDIKGWLKVKRTVLHGFILCSDGRLYHPMLCEEAVKAYELRIKKNDRRKADNERLQAWREGKKKQPSGSDGGNNETGGETPNGTRSETGNETSNETRFTSAAETRVETQNVVVDNTTQYNKEKKGKEESTPKPPRGLVSDSDSGLDEFWALYPRKEGKGHARAALLKALRKATAAEIIAGLRAYRFTENPKFIPYPASWLNGEFWLQADDADDMDPVLKAAGVTQADLDRHFAKSDDQSPFPALRFLQ